MASVSAFLRVCRRKLLTVTDWTSKGNTREAPSRTWLHLYKTKNLESAEQIVSYRGEHPGNIFSLAKWVYKPTTHRPLKVIHEESTRPLEHQKSKGPKRLPEWGEKLLWWSEELCQQQSFLPVGVVSQSRRTLFLGQKVSIPTAIVRNVDPH